MTLEHLAPTPLHACGSTVSASCPSVVLHQSHLPRCALPPSNHHHLQPQYPQHQQTVCLQLARLVSSVLMLAVIDTPGALFSNQRQAARRRPYGGQRRHVVADPAVGSWDGQRSAAADPRNVAEQPMSTATPSLPLGDEVHTFPGICDDHPPDDLSSIALAPLTYNGNLQSLPEAMQTDETFQPETGVLPPPHYVVAERQLGTFSADVFPTGSGLMTRPEPEHLVQDVGLFQADVPLHTVTTAGGVPGLVLLKEEVPSPTDLAMPGTSGSGAGVYAGSSVARPGWTPSGAPSSPVIPLTALELLSRDSDSSGSDTESGPGQAGSSKSASRSSTGSGASRHSGTSGRTLDRQKVSDDGDSSDDSNNEDMSLDDQDRLDRRRLSNRVAAQKCRTRQRQHYRGLMKEIQDLECKNTGLNYEVRQLQKTLRAMLQEVADHEAKCTTGTPALTSDEKQAYQKLLDDVSESQTHSKGKGKSSK